jgi:hypothetical protein
MSSALITNVDRKQLQKTKFPPEFDRKVDMEKVNVPVIKKWLADEIARLLNDDDDVLTDTISNVLEESRFVSCQSSTGSGRKTHANSSTAKNQGATDIHYWFPRSLCCAIR